MPHDKTHNVYYIFIKVDYHTLNMFLLCKSNKTIQMFFGKFTDEGDNQYLTKRRILNSDLSHYKLFVNLE
jgi:hypothetical protein